MRRNGALAALVTGRDSDTLTLIAVGKNGRLFDASCSILRPPLTIQSLSIKGERLQLPDITGPSPLTVWNEGTLTTSNSFRAHPDSAVALYRVADEIGGVPVVVYQDGSGSIVSQQLTKSGWEKRAYIHL